VNSEPKLAEEFAHTWDGVAAAYVDFATIYRPYSMLEKYPARCSSLFMLARTLVRMREESKKPNEGRLREFRETALAPKRQYISSPVPLYPSFEIRPRLLPSRPRRFGAAIRR
jgi:hypothetical protein